VTEERRLLYVGLTRSRRHLCVTWTQRPSRFLAELGLSRPEKARGAAAPEPDDPVYAALKRWRLERAKADEVPAYVVFHNSTLAEVAARRPKTLSELSVVPGVGPTKLERYGEQLLEALGAS
jgi:ATP-dependent DNA helicase RecQ